MEYSVGREKVQERLAWTTAPARRTMPRHLL